MFLRVGDDGLPCVSGSCMGDAERVRLERKAQLQYAFQMGQEASGADVRAYKIVLLDKLPGDGEAQIEFERGLSHGR